MHHESHQNIPVTIEEGEFKASGLAEALTVAAAFAVAACRKFE
jgi:hypothetical protein